MEQTTKRKAKRVLKNIDFENGKDTHIALVHKDQGGPANGAAYKLVLKGQNFSEDFIKKASMVTVEMEITEYLQRFFGLWGEDAEILARSLGFTTAGQEKFALEQAEEQLEMQEAPKRPEWDSKPGDKDFEAYVVSRVASIDVMKALYESENIPETLSKLSEEEYLSFLQDQEMLEKAFKDIEKNSTAVAVENGATDSGAEEAEKSEISKGVVPETIVNKGTDVMQEQNTEVQVEMIEKAQFESVQKALEAQAVELQKALDVIKQFEAEKKEAIQKARFDLLKSAVKNDEKAEVLFKAIGLVEDENEFQAVVKAIGELVAQVEKSDLFVEKGAEAQGTDEVIENPLRKLLEAKFAKQ